MKHATDRRTEESTAEAHVYIVRYLHFMIKVPGAVWGKPLCTLFTVPCLAPFNTFLAQHIRYIWPKRGWIYGILQTDFRVCIIPA